MTPPQFKALTLHFKGGLQRVLISECHACAAFDPATLSESQPPPLQSFSAIWDTGATSSVINKRVVDVCGLKPTGMTQVQHAGGISDAETFLVAIWLPNGVGFSSVQVTRADLRGADILIGMDIITRGDFSITNLGGSTVFSFRCPSVRTVDFVKEAAHLSSAAAPPFYKGFRQKKKRK